MGELVESNLSWQLWASENIGHLLATTPGLINPPSKKTISTAIAAYVKATSKGEVSKFARRVGIGKQQVRRHIEGKTLPSLKTLLQLCGHLGVPLLNFLTKEPTVEDLKRASVHLPRLENSVGRKPFEIRHNSASVRIALEQALLENPPPSAQELAVRLGYAEGCSLYYHASDLAHALAEKHAAYKRAQRLERMQHILRTALQNGEYPPPSMREVARREGLSVQPLTSAFPELSRAISDRHREYQQMRKATRIEKLRQEVREAALQLHKQGTEPTGARVSKYLSKPGSILQQPAIEALQEIQHELGWKS